MQRRKLMDFTFTRAMMKLKKANLIKLEQGINGNLLQIQVQFGLGFQPAHQLVFLALHRLRRPIKMIQVGLEI